MHANVLDVAELAMAAVRAMMADLRSWTNKLHHCRLSL
jgi:hypothetical protein